MLLTATDMALQPLHNLQARFVLQKNYPNYKVYRSIAHALRRHKNSLGELYLGARVYLPINFIRIVSANAIGFDSRLAILANSLCSHVLAYPFLTLQRRLEVQSRHVNTMAPFKTKSRLGSAGLLAMAKDVWAGEGWRGFYRGFLGYSILVGEGHAAKHLDRHGAVPIGHGLPRVRQGLTRN